MIFSDPNCFSSQLSQLRSGICTPNVRANYKSFQFTTLTDIVSKKLKELNESNELMSNNAPISPLEHINLPSPTATPVTPFNYLPTTPTRKSKTERRFNYNLTDSKMIKFVKGGGGAYDTTSYFNAPMCAGWGSSNSSYYGPRISTNGSIGLYGCNQFAKIPCCKN